MYMNDGNKTKINLRNKSVFITGVAGFIGSNLAKRLLSTVEGVKVVGLDNMNHYYDVRLKEARLNELEQFDNFSFVKGNLADKAVIESIFEQYKPEIVVNLGAQAGVRYSITNPDAYVEANLIGFYNILEACRHSYDEGHTPVEHLVYASSSSVYGSNKKVPYSTDDKVDNPVSLYAATKKSNELMAHAYSKLYNIPSTGLRFFTVYGPAGRPDMAYFGFTNKLLKGETIQIFNYGNCKSRAITHSFGIKLKALMLGEEVEITFCDVQATKKIYKFTEVERMSFVLFGILYASRCNNFHGNVAARMNSINANKDTFKMYTDMFLTEYIILAIHLNSQGVLSDVVLNKVKENADLMI
jgi:nucleoside-diphosphate-sugar epimerase